MSFCFGRFRNFASGKLAVVICIITVCCEHTHLVSALSIDALSLMIGQAGLK